MKHLKTFENYGDTYKGFKDDVEFLDTDGKKTIPNPEKPYVLALFNNDKELAKELIEFKTVTEHSKMSSHKAWTVICDRIGYPYYEAISSGIKSEHFEEVLLQLASLARTGKHDYKW